MSSQQFFQINANKITVVAKPIKDDPSPMTETEIIPKTEPTDISIIDDFALYSARKRTAPYTTNDRSTKKGKAIECHTVPEKSAMDAD